MSEKKPRYSKPASESVPATLPVGLENWVDVTVAIRHQWVHYPGDRVEDVDAPVHLISGAPGVGKISVDPLIGPLRLIEAKEHEPIAWRHIDNFPQRFSQQPSIYAAGVIENEGIKRRPKARQSSTDSKDRYWKRQLEVA